MAQWNDGNYAITLTRAYDAYSQLVSETIFPPLSIHSSASQTWDAAGRRSRLNFMGGFNYSYIWRADGLLESASVPVGTGSYAYNLAGVLTNRVVGSRTTTINSLDGVGRPLSIITKVGGLTKLTETLAYTGDGLLNAHTLAREDFTNAAAYSYAPLTRRLTNEVLNLDATQRWTNSFAYDGGVAAGPGALTKAGATPSTPRWSGGMDAFSRINSETNTFSRRPAYGRVNGDATIAVLLDGKISPVTMVGTDDPLWPGQWRTEMEMTPGTHQLTVSATHPSGQFVTNKSVWFTNNAANEQVLESYDGRGKLTLRVWKSANGTTNRTQTIEWDALGRLWFLLDLDARGNGYYINPVYDPLDRRIGSYFVPMEEEVPVEVHWEAHYFDPQVEFLELGQAVDYETTTWKLCGPDLNGAYGGLQGTGGFDAVAPGLGQFQPTISDARGNILGAVSNGVIAWTSARPTGYGAVPGYRPLASWQGGNLVQSSAWCGRYVDVTGYIYLGARYYNPESGSFLDADPMWNGRDPNSHTFCGGDPINCFDADGRWGKKTAGVTFDIFTTLLADIATPKPNVPPELLSPAERQMYASMSGMVHDAIGHPFQDAGFYEPNSGAAAIRDVAAMGVEMYGLAKSGQSMVNVNVSVPEPNYSAPRTGFYVTPDGVAVPATGYRAMSGSGVTKAQSGTIEPRENRPSYITFDNITRMSPAEVQSRLQLDPRNPAPTHVGVFDTLQLANNLRIPTEYYNTGLFPEPITVSYPRWGAGGATQGITYSPIQGVAVVPLVGQNAPPSTITAPNQLVALRR